MKRHYSQPASLELIRRSVAVLYAWYTEHPDAHVHMVFPGIGNGGLARAQVLPLVKSLANNVQIWEYGRPPTPARKEPWTN